VSPVPELDARTRYRSIFLVTSVLYLCYWLGICLHFVRVWGALSVKQHLDCICFLVSSLGLWIFLREEKVTGLTMMAACFVLITTANLVWVNP
jgi:hypothetical protein